MTTATSRVSYRSPLHEMTQTTPTCLWNDSAAIDELSYAIEHGAVGATCNPVIALSVIRGDLATWGPRLDDLVHQLPLATEDAIAWRLVEELSVRAARLLEPAFEADHGRNGRLSIQTDPRRYRDSDAIVEQAEAFSRLAPNMIVKIPVTRAGIRCDRGGDVPRDQHQRDGLLHRRAVHRGGRGRRTRPATPRAGRDGRRVDGTGVHDHGRQARRLAEGDHGARRHRGRPGVPGVVGGGGVQEGLPGLP